MKQSDEITTVTKYLLTMEEAAQALSLGRTFFYRLVLRKQIHSVKVGRRRLVPLKALHAYIDQMLAEEGYHV